MPRRFTRMTRRSVVGAVVGLAFAAVAGVGLAQVTTGSSLNPFAAEGTTDSQATIARKVKPGKNKHKPKQQTTTISTTSSSTTTTITSSTTTTTPTPTTPTAAGGGVLGAGQEKFDVCHKAGGHNEHTINIAAPAVPAHMAHGDTMGPCAITTSTATTTATMPTTTTTTAVPTTTLLQKKPKAQKQPKVQKQHKAATPQQHAKQHKPKSSSHGTRSGKSGGHGKKAGGKHK